MEATSTATREIGVYQVTGENLDQLVRLMDLYETDRPEHSLVFVTKNGNIEAWVGEDGEMRITGYKVPEIYVSPSWANAELIVSVSD